MSRTPTRYNACNEKDSNTLKLYLLQQKCRGCLCSNMCMSAQLYPPAPVIKSCLPLTSNIIKYAS